MKGFPISFQVRWSRLGWNRPGCGHTTGGRDLRPSDPSPHSFLNAGYLRTGDVLVSSLNVTSSHLPLSSRVVLSQTFYSCELCDGRRCGAGGQRADHGEAFTSGCNEARHTFTRRSSRGALRGEETQAGSGCRAGSTGGCSLLLYLPPPTHRAWRLLPLPWDHRHPQQPRRKSQEGTGSFPWDCPEKCCLFPGNIFDSR